jgi:NADH-quinone oxidoreductase subunit J
MNILLLSLFLPGAATAQPAAQAAQAAAQVAGSDQILTGSWIGTAYFAFCAALALLGAIATIASPNPIRGAMGLLLMIVSIAGLFLALHAQFLAAIQLIVYAGAVVVLFLFVIMILGPSATSTAQLRDSFSKYVAYGGAGLLVAVGALTMRVLARGMINPKLPGEAPADFGSIDSLGKVMFTDALIPFEISSALLIVAVVGALAIAKGKHGEPSSANANTNANANESKLASSTEAT